MTGLDTTLHGVHSGFMVAPPKGRSGTPSISPDALARLVTSHRDFLAFLSPRVGSQAAAEDILQAAFVRAMERGGALQKDESVVAWFYRLLRNAVVDHYRRRATAQRAASNLAAEADIISPESAHNAVCGCLNTLVPTLKPEYAQVLQRADLDEVPVNLVAQELGITPNLAGVRLHRARKALKRQLALSCGTCATHGCLDCSCQSPGTHEHSAQ